MNLSNTDNINNNDSSNRQRLHQIHADLCEHERSTKSALQLKRKELKWKLMLASQRQNRARLDEIKAETNYHRKRTIKIAALANKLKTKYLKVAKAAQIAEDYYKKCERQLLTQEKFVADEKMQLTKLAVDCRNIGIQLYGPEYKLVINNSKTRPASGDEIEKTLTLLRNRKTFPSTRLSSLYDLKDSLLRNLASYRLTKSADNEIPLTNLSCTHNICPHDYICLPDLIGNCADKNCSYQHKSNYLMSDIDKLVDLLSYRPSIAGFKWDPNLGQEENETSCRFKLKLYAARLLAKNSSKCVEEIAQDLVEQIRANKSDIELLVSTRELPKVRHMICHKSATESESSSEESSDESEVIEAIKISQELAQTEEKSIEVN